MVSRAPRIVSQRTPGLFHNGGEKEDESGQTTFMNKNHVRAKIRKNPVAKLGPDIHEKIGMQLRLMFGEVVDQGVPDRFAQMLERLDDPNCEGR
jgi:hypothetical protein